MRRREFITLISGAAATWPVVGVRAQQAERVRRIGVLMGIPENDRQAQPEVAALEASLRQLGWIPGRNVQITYRWPGGNMGLTETFAQELISLQPDVLLSRNTPATAVLKNSARDIPIVFVMVVEPIASGLVASLARPGGNITGFTNFESSLSGKWLDLLKEVSPSITDVKLLFNPRTAPYARALLQAADVAAPARSVNVIASPVQDVAALEQAVIRLANQPNAGLVGMPDSFIIEHRKVIIGLAARHRMPAVFPNPICTQDGGLMAYGVDNPDLFRRAASYIDRIFKGDKPADLPVQQPTKFELVINLKTAKALGIIVPPTLLARADEVIE